MVVWSKVVLLVVVVMLLVVREMDGFENYIHELNGEVGCQLGYELYRKGGYHR